MYKPRGIWPTCNKFPVFFQIHLQIHFFKHGFRFFEVILS